MKWQELELSDALIGMHVLVKGYNRNNGKWFHAIGYIDKYSNQLHYSEKKTRNAALSKTCAYLIAHSRIGTSTSKKSNEIRTPQSRQNRSSI